MPVIRDDAICLRLLDWSETSQIVVLLTAEYGKISGAAKGAKRTNPSAIQKFSGGFDLLTRGEVVLYTKAGRELANLAEWDLRETHPHLRRELRAHQLAMYAADMTHHLLSDHDPHRATFDALVGFLEALADAKRHAPALVAFQWRVIEDCGYRPELEQDAETGAALDREAGTVAFSPLAGGLVADTGAGDRWRTRQGTAAVLRRAAGGESLTDLPAPDVERAARLLCTYIRSIIDRHLATMDAILGGE